MFQLVGIKNKSSQIYCFLVEVQALTKTPVTAHKDKPDILLFNYSFYLNKVVKTDYIKLKKNKISITIYKYYSNNQ